MWNCNITRNMYLVLVSGLPRWCCGKESACQCRKHKRLRFDPWVGKIPWRRTWQPTPICLPGESHGQKSLAGSGPLGHKSQTQLKWLSMHTLVPGTELLWPCNFWSGRGERKIIIGPIKHTWDDAKEVTLGPWRASGWGWLPEETTETGGWNVSPTPNFTEGRRAGQLVQLFNRTQLFVTPWTAAHQPSLLITNSQGLLKLMSIESVMPSNHLILCRPLLLLPSIFPSIRVFSNESVLRIRWPKFWSFSLNIPMNIQDWFPLGLTGFISLQFKGLLRVFSNTTVQKHQFFGIHFLYGSILTSIHTYDYWKNHNFD